MYFMFIKTLNKYYKIKCEIKEKFNDLTIKKFVHFKDKNQILLTLCFLFFFAKSLELIY